MKLLPLVAILFFVLVFMSCSSQDNTTIVTSNTSNQSNTVETASSFDESKRDWDYKFSKQNKSIPISAADFNALVSFIIKEGFPVGSGEKQYTFFDSHKNRHAMIIIKRDEDNKPSKEGQVVQISVWAYDKGIKDQEHFFGYEITPERGVFTSTDTPEYNDKHFSKVKFGYEEFLAKVKQSS